MPEGPEIRRAADSLEAAIKGEPLTEAWFAFPQLQHYQSQLVGQRVTRIETRGKALLTHFSSGGCGGAARNHARVARSAADGA